MRTDREMAMDEEERKQGTGSRLSLKMRLVLMLVMMVVPLTVMVLWILGVIHSYSISYNKIMANLKIANSYNLQFKTDMEYSMYRVMIGMIDVEQFQDGDIMEGSTEYGTIVKNPFTMIAKARHDFSQTIERIPGSDGDIKIKGILSCLDSLERAVDKMIGNSRRGGTYDENNAIWENDVQGLCSMIQDYITRYMYYEMMRMEELQKQLETSTRQLLGSFLPLLAVVLAGGILVSSMITSSVTRPIQELKEAAERLGRGEMEAGARPARLEEIDVLARTFNRMRCEIVELMKKQKEEQKNLWAAELKLMQEQINPHFLYNTLDSIVWMAEGGNNRQVVEMTTDLSDFFRTVLSEGRDFITVAEEELHTRSYLKIQKIRYEDILDFRIEIDPDIKNRSVLKMILQPIVENALYHGIKNKRGGGTIVVRGYEDRNGIVFEVEDDGIGMDETTLERLQNKIIDGENSGNEAAGKTSSEGGRPPRRGGFGMNNVAQRIRMYYGSDSGIAIESQKGVGTCIKVYLDGRHRESDGVLS